MLSIIHTSAKLYQHGAQCPLWSLSRSPRNKLKHFFSFLFDYGSAISASSGGTSEEEESICAQNERQKVALNFEILLFVVSLHVDSEKRNIQSAQFFFAHLRLRFLPFSRCANPFYTYLFNKNARFGAPSGKFSNKNRV